MSFSLSSFFSKIGTDLHNFFTKEAGPIKTVTSEAQLALATASSVASIMGEPASVTGELGKISDGLGIIQAGVSAASSATDLNGYAAAVTKTVSGLVNSGDINVKSGSAQAAIGVALTKVQSVVGVLETAATVAPVAATAK